MRPVLKFATIFGITLIICISGCVSCPFSQPAKYITATPAVTTTPPPPPPPPVETTATATAAATSTPTPVPTPEPTPTPTPKPTQLSVPGLTNPVNDQSFVNPPRNITFSWSPVPNAASYKLEVEENISGWINRVNVQVTGTTYSKTIGYGPTQWRWRVTALGAGAYTNSTPGQWRYFKFVIG